jgi:hypothetical protein
MGTFGARAGVTETDAAAIAALPRRKRTASTEHANGVR